MDEFLKLFLTSVRLQNFKKFNAVCIAAAAAQLLLIFPLAFIAAADAHAAISLTFGVLIIVAGIANAVLSFKSRSYCNALAAEQIAAESLDGEQSAARKNLAEKFLKVYGKQKNVVLMGLAIIPTALSAVAAIISSFLKTENSEWAVAGLVVASLMFGAISSIAGAANDSKYRAALYEEADKEIAVLKRGAGFSQGLISKQSHAARNTSTRSQELFLRDPADIKELRRISSAMGWGGVALTVTLAAIIFVLELLSDNYDNTFMTVCSFCVIAAMLVLIIAIAVRTEIKRQAIYRRNEKKLTDSETDNMRRFLQSEFIKLQRRGNLLFLILCGLSTLTGIILGAIGAINDPKLSFVENVLGMGTAFFFLSAIAATVIWTIIYCVYRNKVKPVEMQLNNARTG